MRKSLVGVALAFLACAAVACDGGGGSGGGGYLTAGNYLISGTAVNDGCQTGLTPADYDGNALALTTNGNIVTFGGVDLTRNGNSLTFSETVPQDDLFGDGSCLADVSNNIDGTITGNNELDIDLALGLANGTGAGCSALPIPCTTTISFHAALQ